MHDYDGGIAAKTTKMDLLLSEFLKLRINTDNLAIFAANFAIEIAVLNFPDDEERDSDDFFKFLSSVKEKIADYIEEYQDS